MSSILGKKVFGGAAATPASKSAVSGGAKGLCQAYYQRYIATSSAAPIFHAIAFYSAVHWTITQTHKHSQNTGRQRKEKNHGERVECRRWHHRRPAGASVNCRSGSRAFVSRTKWRIESAGPPCCCCGGGFKRMRAVTDENARQTLETGSFGRSARCQPLRPPALDVSAIDFFSSRSSLSRWNSGADGVAAAPSISCVVDVPSVIAAAAVLSLTLSVACARASFLLPSFFYLLRVRAEYQTKKTFH